MKKTDKIDRKVLKFLDTDLGRYTPETLSNNIDLSQSQVYNSLRRLVSEDKVSCVKIGRVKYYKSKIEKPKEEIKQKEYPAHTPKLVLVDGTFQNLMTKSVYIELTAQNEIAKKFIEQHGKIHRVMLKAKDRLFIESLNNTAITGKHGETKLKNSEWILTNKAYEENPVLMKWEAVYKIKEISKEKALKDA
jgi:DNA-binding Lrp family transcriptional regulator